MYQFLVFLSVFIVPFITAYFLFPPAITILKKVGILGKDMNKPDQPEITEMGGLVIVAGFGLSIIISIAVETFFPGLLDIDLKQIFAALSVVLIMALVGIVDDLIGIRQFPKAILPLLASLPLVAIRAGDTTMLFPVIGHVDFGIFFPLILVPIAITGASNAVNMLAGFNGLEAGMGVVAAGALALIAYFVGATTSFVILLALIGVLMATLRYNWYPAKVFIGDVGTFSIGAIIASAVILGNYELAGVIVIIPYVLDFLIKAVHKFPSNRWWGVYREGKLFCPEKGSVGLAQLVMKVCGGVKERELVLILIGIEVIFGVIAILLYI